MGCKYVRLSINTAQWGWLFPDGSRGYFDFKDANFRVFKE
jgi:hypothetical protein